MALEQLRDRRRRTVGPQPPALQPAAQGHGLPSIRGTQVTGVQRVGPALSSIKPSPGVSSAAIGHWGTSILTGTTGAQQRYAKQHPGHFDYTTKLPSGPPSAAGAGSAAATNLTPTGGSVASALQPGQGGGLQSIRRRRRKPRTLTALPAAPTSTGGLTR